MNWRDNSVGWALRSKGRGCHICGLVIRKRYMIVNCVLPDVEKTFLLRSSFKMSYGFTVHA
jgi:hypothetical protein